jgi:hypothetical protein
MLAPAQLRAQPLLSGCSDAERWRSLVVPQAVQGSTTEALQSQQYRASTTGPAVQSQHYKATTTEGYVRHTLLCVPEAQPAAAAAAAAAVRPTCACCSSQADTAVAWATGCSAAPRPSYQPPGHCPATAAAAAAASYIPGSAVAAAAALTPCPVLNHRGTQD